MTPPLPSLADAQPNNAAPTRPKARRASHERAQARPARPQLRHPARGGPGRVGAACPGPAAGLRPGRRRRGEAGHRDRGRDVERDPADRTLVETMAEIPPCRPGRSHGTNMQEPENARSMGTALRYLTAAGMATQRAQRAFLAHRKAKQAGLIARGRARGDPGQPELLSMAPESPECTNELPAPDPLAPLRAQLGRPLGRLGSPATPSGKRLQGLIAPHPSPLVGKCGQVRLLGVDHEHGEQASRFRIARVRADAMMITRQFGEAITGAIYCLRAVIDLASDRTLQDRGPMNAESGWVCAGDEPPGWYSTSTPFMLLPGTFGRAWS